MTSRRHVTVSQTVVSISLSISMVVWLYLCSTQLPLWQGTKFAVFFCPVINNSATVAPIDVTFCIMVHIGPGHVFSPFEAVLPGDPLSPKFCA